MTGKSESRWTLVGISIFIAAVTWFVFGQTRHFGFVNYDDDLYVYDNAIIKAGVTWPGLKWAFTYSHARNWHPLTTISHMLDCQIYGLNAGPQHLTNVALHMISAILLFFILRNLTRGSSQGDSTWPSAIVAALFAVHPQHVESVAWISERKDVLSGLFFLLTLAAYVRYARAPSLARYVTISILFACGLMAKPMLVTLPFVLLLLDYWPLNRGQMPEVGGQKVAGEIQVWLRLIAEKIPLLVLSAGASLITLLIQVYAGAQFDPLPLSWRIENALVSYVIYIWQMLWPVRLAALYPQPESQLPFWEIALAAALLIIITAAAIKRRRINPYFFVGWFWYLGMLVPVIGIVQLSSQGWADRYTYLPAIGLYLAAVWTVVDLASGLRYRRRIGLAVAALVVCLCACVARTQAFYWRDSESLWSRALDVTTENHLAHNNVGSLLDQRGQLDQALQQYQEAVQIRSRFRSFHRDFLLAVYHSNMAGALRRKGQIDEAISHSRTALELQPDYGMALRNLAAALVDKGQIDDAIPLYRKVCEIYRGDPESEIDLATTLLRKGMDAEAVAHFEEALRFDPESLKALNNLSWLYATNRDQSIRNGAKAVNLAERAVQISGGENPFYLHKLAAAYAEQRDFDKALAVADRARILAVKQENAALAIELQRNIDVYRTNSPLRDSRQPR